MAKCGAFLFFSLSSCLLSQPQKAIDVAWLPITDADRNLKAPVVEKNAGVEALFWRVHVRDELLGGQELQRVMYHYIRLKVFDEKGKEKVSTIELHMPDKTFVAYL